MISTVSKTAGCLTFDSTSFRTYQSLYSYWYSKMLCSLKYCVRSYKKSTKTIKCRYFSQLSQQNESKFGRNGHYDIIIVGGGATGISLAGAIGNE